MWQTLKEQIHFPLLEFIDELPCADWLATEKFLVSMNWNVLLFSLQLVSGLLFNLMGVELQAWCIDFLPEICSLRGNGVASSATYKISIENKLSVCWLDVRFTSFFFFKGWPGLTPTSWYSFTFFRLTARRFELSFLSDFLGKKLVFG